MKFHFMMAACIAAVLSLPLVAQAQGVVRGAEEGAAEGIALPVRLGARSAVPLAASSVALKECSEFRNEAVRLPAAIALIEPSFRQIRSATNLPLVPPASRQTCA